MVTTSFPEVAFGAQNYEAAWDESSTIVLHLDGDKLRTAAEDALKNGKQFREKLDFYMEDGSEEQTEMYRQLFEDGGLYEISLEDTYAATPSDAAKKGEVTLLVRPDMSGMEKATASDATMSDATDSDAVSADYQVTGNEQVIVLFRNDSDEDRVYQIEIDGSLSPEIKVPAGETLVAETASPSDSVEAEEPASDGGEEAVQLPADDGVPSVPSTPGNGHTDDGNSADQGQTEDGTAGSDDVQEPSDSEDSQKPSDSEDSEKPSDSEDSEKPSDSEDSQKPSDSEDSEKPSDSEDSGKTSDSEDSQEQDDAESSDKEDGKTENSDEGQKEENSGNSGSSDAGADKAASLSLSRHIVPRVAAVGPSGVEYPDDYDPYDGMTPEEAWEEFQENGDEDEDEDEEEVTYEDELSTMSEETVTGMEGTVLDPVLVKTRRNVFAKIARAFLASDKPVGAAVYVSTLDGMTGRVPAAEGAFTVDLFDYGTFDGNIDPTNAENFRRSNNIQEFNQYISRENQEHKGNESEGKNDSYLMSPEDGWLTNYSNTGASAVDSLVRGIMEWDEEHQTIRFSEGAKNRGNNDVTLFPSDEDQEPENSNIMKVYRNVEFPMLKEEGSNHYKFSSKDTFVSGYEHNGQWNLKNEGTPGGSGNAQPYPKKEGFWPLNKWSNSEQARDKAGNQYFGMKLSTEFFLPSDGKYNGEPLKFEFSGDDDVWVFIDGKLALDIGGAHRPVTGTIDFATGFTQVRLDEGSVSHYNAIDGKDKIELNPQNGSRPNYVAGYIYGDEEQLESIKVSAKQYGINPDWVEGARCVNIDRNLPKHRLDFYLVERAPYGSNCTIDFTLPVPEKGMVNVFKNVVGSPQDPNAEFVFEIQKLVGTEWENYTDSTAGITDGIFTLTTKNHIQTFTAEKGTYRIKEREARGANKTTWAGTTPGTGESAGWQIIEVTNPGETKMVTCTNSFIDESQTHDLTVTKEVLGGETISDSIKFLFDITLDFANVRDENCPENITYSVDGIKKQVPVDKSSRLTTLSGIELADEKTVNIQDLPYNTRYEVTEQTVTDLYESKGALDGNATGTIEEQDVAVTWLNSRKNGNETIGFTLEKIVEDVSEEKSAPVSNTYTFSLYEYPVGLDNKEGFWEPYTGEYYVNGKKITGNGSFNLTSPDDLKAYIEIPKGKENSVLMLKETDNGNADKTEWDVEGKKVSSLDSPAFILNEISGKTITCTNSYNVPRSLKVFKQLEEGSENPEPGTTYSFTVSGSGISDNKRNISVGEDFTVDGLMKDETYTIKEEIPPIRGYEGSLARVEGATPITGKNEATIEVGINDNIQTVDKIAYVYQIKLKRWKTGFIDHDYCMEATLKLVGMNGTVLGDPIEPPLQKVTISNGNNYPDEREVVQALLDKIPEDAPYHLEEGNTYYSDFGKENAQWSDIKLGSILDANLNDWGNPLKPKEPSISFLVLDGYAYQYNEYMKYMTKEKLQEQGLGTINTIELVNGGYYGTTFSYGGFKVPNAATMHLRATIDTSATATDVVTFYNKWEKVPYTNIKIAKELTKGDTEGNTFYYRITDPNGNSYVTSIHIDANEKTGERILTNVPAGEYTIRELPHMRYQAVVNETDGYTGSIVKIEAGPLGNEDSILESNIAKFKNEKQSSGYFSDSISVENKVEGNEFVPYVDGEENTNPGIYQEQPDAVLPDKKQNEDGTVSDTPEPPAD